ncbi:hypothetical protein G9A89_007763 [Geosiphon pyriformis]|nr:hypothetical protein G9A89_007763 [Geosiphon pyriformis]
MELKHSRKHFTSTLKIASTIIFLETTTFQKKQKLRTTPNTPKTTAKHLQTSEQETSFKLPLLITPFPASLAQLQTPSLLLIRFSKIEDFQSPKSPIQQPKPILTNTNLIDYLTENQSEETKSEQETEDSENEEEMASTYIAKISEFTGEDSETSPQEWLDKVSKAEDANGWNAARIRLRSIQNCFPRTQEPSESVITYLGRFNKLLRRICQLETNEYYSNAQILDQFIAGLKDKLIKKVHSHAPKDLATAIQQTKNYKMAMKKANRTKLVNLAIEKTSSTAKEKIDQLTKKVENYFTNQQQQQQPQQSQQPQKYQPLQRQNQNNFAPLFNNHYNKTNKIGVINITLHHTYYLPKPQYQSNYYQPAPQPIQQQYQQPPTQYYQVPTRRLILQNQPNHYHTQPSYLMMPEKQDFCHTALSEGRAAAQQQNLSYIPTTIPPARIAENTNLSDIFPFEFEANESPFLLSNAAANEQKPITAIYTEAEVEGKPIHLILDNGSARSIIIYQLMQQLKRNIN